MDSISLSRKRKRFLSWVALENEIRQRVLIGAMEKLVPPLEEMGFEWKNESFVCGLMPANMINLERAYVVGQVDYVTIIFDKRHAARFQITCGTRERELPQKWVRSGALVWKKVDDSVKFKWWGARWWHLDKDLVLEKSIDRAVELLPQIASYLSGEAEQNNIWPS